MITKEKEAINLRRNGEVGRVRERLEGRNMGVAGKRTGNMDVM